MADEPAVRFDGGQAAPDFLTVAPTADVLQIGRSTTYELVGLFVEGDEVRGIPAFLVGGQYRIPRARLEEYSGKPLTWPPAPRQRKLRPARRTRKVSGEAPQPEGPHGTSSRAQATGRPHLRTPHLLLKISGPRLKSSR